MENILLIEDNPILLKIWKEQLRKMHFQVSTALNGYTGLNTAIIENPDLLLIDSMMPDLDGFAFCETIRHTPTVGKIPIILLSNFNLSDDMKRAFDAGAADYLLKFELTPALLHNKIKSILLLNDRPEMAEEKESPEKELLVDAGIVTEKQVKEALKEMKSSGLSLVEVLIKLDMIPASDKHYLLEIPYRVDYVKLSEYTISKETLSLVPKKTAVSFNLIPLEARDDELIVAMLDPRDVSNIDYLRNITSRRIKPVYSSYEEIDHALILYYGAKDAIVEIKKRAEEEPEKEIEEKTASTVLGEAAIVEIVDVHILKAVEAGASDIHFEPEEEEIIVRFRIDGILHDVEKIPASAERAVSSRIKLISAMDISEKRLPQDGKFQMKLKERIVDFRVSSVPTVCGEKIVIRILDPEGALITLENMGFNDEGIELFKSMIKRPYGMILLTGPTGSGKTTTLYAALNWLKSTEINIMSIEDPVEYRIQRVNQIQINNKIDLTFAKILRSILRQDPNIIMIGEIRDLETAELAVQASLTGHLVLGTLHTNDAPSAIIRLIDMGIPEYLVASTVNGIISQRLMRKICPECKEEVPLSEEEKERLLPGGWVPDKLIKGRGCRNCSKTGYKSRVAIFEMLPVTKGIRQAILSKFDADTLAEAAAKEGMKTLRDCALEKVKQGVSTLSEAWRVTLEV